MTILDHEQLKQSFENSQKQLDLYEKDNIGMDSFLRTVMTGNLSEIKKNIELHKHIPKPNDVFWSINFRNVYGQDAFLIAAEYGYVDVMKYLIDEYKWDIYTKDFRNNNAGHYAASNGHNDILELLRTKCNFNFSKLNKNGENAYILAVKNSNINTVYKIDADTHNCVKSKYHTVSIITDHNQSKTKLVNFVLVGTGDVEKIGQYAQFINEKIKISNIMFEFDSWKIGIKIKHDDFCKDFQCSVCFDDFSHPNIPYFVCENHHIHHLDCILRTYFAKQEEPIYNVRAFFDNANCPLCRGKFEKHYYIS